MPHELFCNMHFAPGRRIICISDVHGHLSHFDRLLEKIKFTPEDFLIVIGDAIEDGPASLGALRRIMELEKSGCAKMLAGNWDYFIHQWIISDDPGIRDILLKRAIDLRDYSGSSLLSDMCAELGITLTVNSDMAEIMPKVYSAFAEEIAYMGNLPYILDAGDFVCVHGGVPTLDKAELAKLDPYSFLKNDAFAEQGYSFDRWLITGHWPVANYDSAIARFSPHIYPESRIAAIDGGCGKQEAAQLNALIMRAGEPGEFTYDFVDDFPRVRAIDRQAPSKNPIHTNWNTRFMDVLSRSDEFATVYHHASGRQLEVPLKRIWIQNGKEVLGDCTDYELPVEPGDVLSLLFETSKGLCCKKGDISGWYRGRYVPIEE